MPVNASVSPMNKFKHFGKKIDFYFVIIGRGIKKTALEHLAKKLGISDRVIFTGFVPDADLPYFYKLSRSFIIASIAELLSLATLQAMASGLLCDVPRPFS